MLIAVTDFGSVWRHRLGKHSHGSRHFPQPVYYNTTGVVVEGSVRQRPRICGYARFDAVGGFDANHLSRMIGRVFECEEPSVWMGCNKLFFKRLLKAGERPDSFLVVVRSDWIGQLAVGTKGCRSADTWLLSFSECAGQQEVMLLMPVGGWLRSGRGRFALEASQPRLWVARLVLQAGA